MAKLWLTYAWKDNQDQDVDYIVQELMRVGLDVAYDRAHLIPGQRLWPQLDSGISDTNIDGWAILLTENSLKSEACLEELAYALDRALRTRGSEFPLIGIFPAPMDRAIIPSAIATRLYVHLQQSNWATLVADGILKQQPTAAKSSVSPFFARVHMKDGKEILELRPRSGRWHPGAVGVPANGKLKIKSIMVNASGYPSMDGMIHRGSGKSADGTWDYTLSFNAIDPLNSLYVEFDGPLQGEISFGSTSEGNLYFMKSENISR